ncbi:MAG: transposase [Thaumarchaeota archaeon]|nr:transposase [Nitrososphaerota archaeon]
MRATKCVSQPFDGEGLRNMLSECLVLTYNAIAYAQEHAICNRKGMKGFYRALKDVKLPSCYKTAAIGRACGVVASRKNSEKREIETKHPKSLRPAVCIVSGFFISMKGRLFVPLRRDRYFDVQLNPHTIKALEGKKMRSLTITPDRLSFCYSDEVEALPVRRVYGVDRNEKNLTFGDAGAVIRVDMTKAVKVRQMTREVVGSFKRNDVRVRRRLAGKYWKRCKDRTDNLLHEATNFIVDTAARNGAALALEDLTGIRRMYRRGNGQGNDHRFRLNSWPHWKAKQMLEYKAAWKGVTTIPLTRSDTYGSSSECSACGERTHSPKRDDAARARMLWCQDCKKWMDRDANAALNLSMRGRLRFDRSLPGPKSRSQQTTEAEEKGLAGEAVKGNGTTTLILRVDASKMRDRG